MESGDHFRRQNFCQTHGNKTPFWWGPQTSIQLIGTFPLISGYFAVMVCSILAALWPAMETVSAGPFICREKAIRRAAWEACNLEMFKSLHPNGKWKQCQVCAKRKVMITVCFPPSWAKEHKQASKQASAHGRLPLQAAISQVYHPTLPHKCSFATKPCPLPGTMLPDLSVFIHFLTNLPPSELLYSVMTTNGFLALLESNSTSLC